MRLTTRNELSNKSGGSLRLVAYWLTGSTFGPQPRYLPRRGDREEKNVIGGSVWLQQAISQRPMSLGLGCF